MRHFAAPAVSSRPELPEKGRLSDTCVAVDEHKRRAALLDRLEKGGHLTVTSKQGAQKTLHVQTGRSRNTP